MKYSDYNLVILDFVQESSTTFATKNYIKVEFDAILTKIKKSNIVMATATAKNGSSSIHVGCVQGYDESGYPKYTFTSDNGTFALKVSEVDDGTGITKYKFYFDVVQ